MKGLESAGRAAARQITDPTPPVEERRAERRGLQQPDSRERHEYVYLML